MLDKATAAKAASKILATTSAAVRNESLSRIADALDRERAAIESANALDLAAAQAANLATPLLKRLAFSGAKIDAAIEGVRALAALPDPLGHIQSATELAPDLILRRVSCPIGVIGVIFESRPDALVQISALCLKSGNACLLKGGSEALNTNRVLAKIICEATKDILENGWVQLLETRSDVAEMLAFDEHIDLIIPRGSNAFVRHIMDNTRIPVMGHADGVCHLYVDRAADVRMAVDVAVDSKCQYPAVCNALETLLVHKDIADVFLPALSVELKGRNCVIRGCERTRFIIDCIPATSEDWDAEYLDLILAVKVVDSPADAIAHINTHGSKHTDAIITSDAPTAEQFMNAVDSADVFWNCSTRFADGFRFGLGAEVGVSTSKLHARGPVGLDGLCSYKWKLIGAGQTVAPFAEGREKFTHREI
ncbi:MAG: glutamate-5-semialdehyde dehydrogenase [Kiritimatiellaeota bacterium]|nr:glutamate-5-semialdehyde dehydrogenase [Kiritimatiellota bacterium]